MKRRDLLRGLALIVAISSAQSVSACSFAESEPDTWGQRLIDYLRLGNDELLDGLFQDYSSLVSFHGGFIDGTDDLSFTGGEAVRRAIVGFRKAQTANGTAGYTPKSLVSARLVGSRQQGDTNKIELLFAESAAVETSCGPSRSETRVDLFYEAGVHDAGEEWVRWSIERIALMPPLATARLNG